MTTYALNGDTLTNGQWVRRGLVWRWVANPAAEPEPELKEAPDYLPRDLIACPFCLARMDERCKGVTRNRDHRARLVKRVCPCGGALRPPEQICGFCRAEIALSRRAA